VWVYGVAPEPRAGANNDGIAIREIFNLRNRRWLLKLVVRCLRYSSENQFGTCSISTATAFAIASQ